jgi:hypothetical protein
MSRILSTFAGAALVASLTAAAPASATPYRHASGRPVVLVVDDPCNPCPPPQVTVCVPGCPVEAPCVSWRDGVFGRRVATYVWPTSGYSVEVVLTRRGDVIVR